MALAPLVLDVFWCLLSVQDCLESDLFCCIGPIVQVLLLLVEGDNLSCLLVKFELSPLSGVFLTLAAIVASLPLLLYGVPDSLKLHRHHLL